MRNLLTGVLVVMLAVGMAGLSAADDQSASVGTKIGGKLIGGVKDLSTAPMQVPAKMVEVGRENVLAGATLGPMIGAEAAAHQATRGAIKTGFFYIPTSEEPLAQAGLSSGDKLAQGIQQSATGWTRIPVQLYQRGKEHFLLLPVGVVEGSEAAALQTTEGLLQTGLFFVPASKEAKP